MNCSFWFLAAIETFLMLIFPFYWHYIYIPVMPASLMGYLQAPEPFIVGVHYAYKDLETPPADVSYPVLSFIFSSFEYFLFCVTGHIG